MYSKKIIDCVMSPKYAGMIKNADGVGCVSNDKCGEVVRIYLQVEDDIIKNAKYKVFGSPEIIFLCESAIGLILNKSTEDAIKITKQDIVDASNNTIAETKKYFASIVDGAIKLAISKYNKNKLKNQKNN